MCCSDPPKKATAAPRSPAERPLKPAETPRQARRRLFPKLNSGAAGAETPGLLSFAPATGLTVQPVLRKPGNTVTPSGEQITSILELGKPLGWIYRDNLMGLMPKAVVKLIGQGGGGVRFLILDTELPGIESLVLLPVFWDQAREALGRVPWLALPDRTTCRFLPAGPWRMVVEMSKDFAKRHKEASEPLAEGFLIRDGDRLIAGARFDSLLRE